MMIIIMMIKLISSPLIRYKKDHYIFYLKQFRLFIYFTLFGIELVKQWNVQPFTLIKSCPQSYATSFTY